MSLSPDVRPFTAVDVHASLDKHWPPAEYVSINEAPTSADRGGSKLDRLVCSVWASRGFELDGVEIKVSMGDWRRELKDAPKADWWWEHVHRFWIAAPADMAVKVAPELPTGWGLLACTEAGCKIVVKACRHDPQPLKWTTVLGLLRAASGCGRNTLWRERQAGVREGREAAKADQDVATGDARIRKELAELRARVGEFEKHSGLLIDQNWNIEETAKAVALVTRIANNHKYQFVSGLSQAVVNLEAAKKHIAALVKDTEALMSGEGGAR